MHVHLPPPDRLPAVLRGTDPDAFLLEVRTDTAKLNEAGSLWPVTLLVAEHFARWAASLEPGKSEMVSVLELGAGTGALGIAATRILSSLGQSPHVVITDLPPVLPLIHGNIAANRSPATSLPLPWGSEPHLADALAALPAGKTTFDALLCCECLYWGGWSLLAEDTRGLLRSTLDAATAGSGGRGRLFLGFTVRDRGRELP
ncbi:hypothetical protein DFJ74DRAFT_710479 [Hyaloraphidium curvatum]|nr:hypothetical protein DFJ74DRAFT_710479 [Hyaloraphidium curvatum]